MTTFDLNTFTAALNNSNSIPSGVDFSGKSLKLNNENDAKPIVDAINACPDLHYLTLTGNTLGVEAAQAIAKALEHHPELKIARFSDMFTGRMKTEIPPALSALGDGMIAAGARLSELDLSDNAFGPIGVEGLAKLLQSDVCSQLQELRLNNNGLGITGGRLLAKALSANPIRLKVFIAGRNRLENDGAIALAKVFQEMGSLEELAMPQNGIYHPGITALSAAFKQNLNLRSLNLNDNTVTHKGAGAFAEALSRLKKLKCINFGDCLLKSKGAKILAQAFKDNSILLESVDLSHNEIGHEACADIVDALTALPDSRDRLARVVLAGNSLGTSVNKKSMKDKLGACAELSDGEGSDDEYVTDSEEEEEQSENEASNEYSDNSEGENTRELDTLIEQTLQMDNSGVEEVLTDVGKFLEVGSVECLEKLGEDAADVIDTHLQAIKDPLDFIQAYVDATLLVSGISDNSETASKTACRLYRTLIERTAQMHAVQWALADCMLRGLSLIKSENKAYKVRWNLAPCFTLLSKVLPEPYFPSALKDTLTYFIQSKMTSLPVGVAEELKKQRVIQ